MIYLYTDYKGLINKAISDHNAIFSKFTVPYGLDEIDLQYMKEIDRAEIINFDTLAIKTPFGITSLENISQGLKILLNIRYLSKTGNTQNLVDIISCGDNILPYIVKESYKYDIRLLSASKALVCKDKADILLNDSIKVDSFSSLLLIYHKEDESEDDEDDEFEEFEY